MTPARKTNFLGGGMPGAQRQLRVQGRPPLIDAQFEALVKLLVKVRK